MIFKDLLIRAKMGDRQAQQELTELYKPFIVKMSMVNGQFDEDLYQELCIVLLVCIQKFRT